MSNLDPRNARAKALNLHGLLAHWQDAVAAGWAKPAVAKNAVKHSAPAALAKRECPD